MLTAMGLELAFDSTGRAADFSLLGDNPDGYFSPASSTPNKIQVDEEGTRRPPPGVGGGQWVAPPPRWARHIELTSTGPFLYGIVDLDTGVPVFG